MDTDFHIRRHEVTSLLPTATLTAVSADISDGAHWRSSSETGLTLGLVKGQLDFSMAHQPRGELKGTLAFALSTDESVETEHRALSCRRLDTLFLHLPHAALDELASGLPELRTFTSANGQHTALRDWIPAPALMYMVEQALSCPFNGALRTLYLQAKGLEMISLMLAGVEGRSVLVGHGAALTTQIDRLYEARHIIEQKLSNPPDLHELARAVGMSVTRLTAGFREQFGLSVVGYVQQRRMEDARNMLEEGRLTVAQVAYSVGYTPAHFSTLFRRRHGYAPSAIQRAVREADTSRRSGLITKGIRPIP